MAKPIEPVDLDHAQLEQAVKDIFHMIEFFHAHPSYRMDDYKNRPEFKFTAIYKLMSN